MRFDLVTVGEVLVDVTIAELAPGNVLHEPVLLRAGGTAVNAALAVDGRAAVVGRVGDDPAAELIRAQLQAAGVEPFLAVDPTLPTGTFVEAMVDGKRSVVTDRGATNALVPADLPELRAAAVLVSGYLLFHERTHAAARAALGSFGALAGVTGGSASLVSRDLDGVTVLIVNAAEARALTGLGPEAAALELAGDAETVCITLGGEGAVAAQDGKLEGVDTRTSRPGAGSGDAFAARFMVALARGDDLATALRAAA